MRRIFIDESWEDYSYWQKNDKSMLKRIIAMIKNISRFPFKGLGKPEPLKHKCHGFWSRRITKEYRLIHREKMEQSKLPNADFITKSNPKPIIHF